MKCSIGGCLKTSSEAFIYLHIQTAHKDVGLHSDRLKIENRKERKLVCDICGVTVIMYYINRHMREVHGNRPVLNCSQCQFSSKFEFILKDHTAGTVSPECCSGFNVVPASDSISKWARNPN